MSEWVACDKPLGAWNIIWLIRVALGGILSYWGWKRDRTLRLAFVLPQKLSSTSVANVYPLISQTGTERKKS
ncbi:hypothetical protein K474DRAFT_1656703 [Panus rudis PR-1116 ss-1]|nr:hypothetical protein K474DRAFT_1656703 [Panus rudis PR-1116 ss-1]